MIANYKQRLIKELDSEDFKVVILRAPMVFGKVVEEIIQLVKFARMFPIFQIWTMKEV